MHVGEQNGRRPNRIPERAVTWRPGQRALVHRGLAATCSHHALDHPPRPGPGCATLDEPTLPTLGKLVRVGRRSTASLSPRIPQGPVPTDKEDATPGENLPGIGNRAGAFLAGGNT